MKTTHDFAIGAWAGGLTALVWFATESVEWETRTPLLWVLAVAVVGLLVLGRVRGQFSAAKGYLVGASPILLLPALLLAAFGSFVAMDQVGAFSEHLLQRPFVAAEWRAQGSARWRMSEDLMASHQLLGRTTEETRALLGPPDNNLGGSECTLAYWLDKRQGWLCLAASQERISSVRLREYHD